MCGVCNGSRVCWVVSRVTECDMSRVSRMCDVWRLWWQHLAMTSSWPSPPLSRDCRRGFLNYPHYSCLNEVNWAACRMTCDSLCLINVCEIKVIFQVNWAAFEIDQRSPPMIPDPLLLSLQQPTSLQALCSQCCMQITSGKSDLIENNKSLIKIREERS